MKYLHYLSANFTKECADIIEENLQSGKINLTDLKMEVKSDGIYNCDFFSFPLIRFKDYYYNNLTGLDNQDAFALALLSFLNSNVVRFELVYYVPYDREYDWDQTFIISNRKSEFKDI